MPTVLQETLKEKGALTTFDRVMEFANKQALADMHVDQIGVTDRVGSGHGVGSSSSRSLAERSFRITLLHFIV